MWHLRRVLRCWLQAGASYLCAKGMLGDNEPVGNRTDMFAAETVRSTMQLLAEKDSTAAKAFKTTMLLTRAAVCQNIGKQASVPPLVVQSSE